MGVDADSHESAVPPPSTAAWLLAGVWRHLPRTEKRRSAARTNDNKYIMFFFFAKKRIRFKVKKLEKY
jgi:hypothetical protein